MPTTYGGFNQFNERCFRQNLLSGFHTCFSVMFLSSALAFDDKMLSDRIYPHDSTWLYIDISMSLGYFSFALPISYHLAYVLKAGFPYGSPTMVMHHALVVVAQATFLLTGYPSSYMAASGLLFELTNVFFIPHVLMQQLGIGGRVATLTGICLVVVYTLARPLACTVLAVLSLFDLAVFAPPVAAGWPAALLGLCCFYGLLLMSWYWYVGAILPATHVALQGALGEEYYHACIPPWLRRAWYRRCTAEGRAQQREQSIRLQALRELQKEVATTDMAELSVVAHEL